MRANELKLDLKDRRIVYELQKDCRRSLGEIARAVGVSKQALHYRMARLERRGVIASYIALVDFAKLGLVNHEIWLQLSPIPKEKKEAFIDDVSRLESVRLVAECAGKFDLLIGILAPNVVEFNATFSEMLRRHPGVVKSYFFSISYQFIAYSKTHLLGKVERKEPFSIADEPVGMELDRAELALLSLLSNNARASTLELAKKAGITTKTVRAKIKRLEKTGVIAGYSAFVEHQPIFHDNYEIFATLHDMSAQKERELEEYCRSHPYSTFFLKCVGRWDIDIGFDARDGSHFQEILNDFRNRFGAIIDDYEMVPIVGWRKFTYYPFKN